MKIVAVLEGTATDGGGFNQALNAILQMRRLCEGRYDFEVLTDREANVGHLAKLGVGAGHFRLALLDRLIAFLCSHPWWFALQARLKLVSPFETRLLRQGCDLVYFLTPSARAKTLQRLNYVATVWDLCHRDAPEFPEIREYEQFRIREHLYRACCRRPWPYWRTPRSSRMPRRDAMASTASASCPCRSGRPPTWTPEPRLRRIRCWRNTAWTMATSSIQRSSGRTRTMYASCRRCCS
jgi:hypothetical protein